MIFIILWRLSGVIVNGLQRFNNKGKRLVNHQLSELLWSTYQKTWFKLFKLPNLNNNMCIITACNPYGEPQSTTLNNYLNRELAHELSAMPVEYSEICAGSKDFSYYEDSFLLECEYSKAIALGRKWQQNAVFWINDNQLYLCACRPIVGGLPETISMGKFTDRLTIVDS